MRLKALSAVIFLAALPVSAEIALLSNGRSLKVASWNVGEETTTFALRTGGEVTIPTDQLERILDDEIAELPETPEAAPRITSRVFPDRSWRYDENRAPLFSSKYNDLIVEAARHFDVDAALVSAVIKAESDYNPKIVSHKGARGLMQLMPATAKRFGVTDSFDPKANIYGGVRYLRWLLRKFEGNADFAVAAYNAGEGNVMKYSGVPPFRETVQYIARISRHVSKLEERAPSLAASK